MDNASAWKQDGILLAKPGRPAKVCNRCGKDVTRQRRYHDQSGYWCVPCSKADKKAYRASHLPCDDCGCDVQRGQERLLDNHRLCEVCWQRRQTEVLRQEMRGEVARQKEQSGQERRESIRKWSIAGLELVVASVLVIYMYPSASERASSYDEPPATAAIRPDAPATQPSEAWPRQLVRQPAPH